MIPKTSEYGSLSALLAAADEAIDSSRHAAALSEAVGRRSDWFDSTYDRSGRLAGDGREALAILLDRGHAAARARIEAKREQVQQLMGTAFGASKPGRPRRRVRRSDVQGQDIDAQRFAIRASDYWRQTIRSPRPSRPVVRIVVQGNNLSNVGAEHIALRGAVAVAVVSYLRAQGFGVEVLYCFAAEVECRKSGKGRKHYATTTLQKPGQDMDAAVLADVLASPMVFRVAELARREAFSKHGCTSVTIDLNKAQTDGADLILTHKDLTARDILPKIKKLAQTLR